MSDSNKKETKSTAAVAAGSGGAAEKAADKPRDKVGDILRKERLTRRITVETIAKDLKLNVSYIKALELSDYDSLPADPYVRVYIRSLTKYLSLDSDSILKEFYKERGLIADEPNEANKIDISVQKQDKNTTVIVVAALIVILAVFAFIANQKGWITPPQDITPAVVEEKPDTAAVVDQDAARAQSDDSILMKLNAPEEVVAKQGKAPLRP